MNPYGAGGYGELGAHAVLSWDGRDNTVFPRRGVFAAVRGTWFAQAWDVDSDFGQVNGNINGYIPLGGALTLAVRAGGKKVFGNYPYMEAAALGRAAWTRVCSPRRTTRCAATARAASRATSRSSSTPTCGCASPA